MKIALVHDYLNEYGGAERVLETLSQMFPHAPIYTAFAVKGSSAWEHFKDKQIIESSLAPILKWHKLYSPLRFLAPRVWEGFDFSGFDVVISSASWYITKGIIIPPSTKHICYCHTPPRFLYGLPTAIEWQRYWPIRIYAAIVNHHLRNYDYLAAQRVDAFVVNSRNTLKRVQKFYGRNAEIIYPPVKVTEIKDKISNIKYQISNKEDYFLIVSRVVGAKGIDVAMEAAAKLRVPLKIVGEKAGLRWEEKKWNKYQISNNKYQNENANIEFLGRKSDEELWQLYAQAKAFLALAEDEDFGMTVVESQAAGTPVIAYYGGGYKETVIEGKTGEFFREYTVESLCEVMKDFNPKHYSKQALWENAKKFSEERFKEKVLTLLSTAENSAQRSV